MQTKVALPNLLNLLCPRPFTAEWIGRPKDYPTESQSPGNRYIWPGCLPTSFRNKFSLNYVDQRRICECMQHAACNMQHSCATSPVTPFPSFPDFSDHHPIPVGGFLGGWLVYYCVWHNFPVYQLRLVSLIDGSALKLQSQTRAKWNKKHAWGKSKWKQSENLCMHYAFAYASRQPPEFPASFTHL